MYEEYKGKRKPMPAELSEQVPVIRNLLQVMNIRIYAEEGIEADDILGTMAKKAEQEGYLVSIVSGDRDLLQLATDTILAVSYTHLKLQMKTGATVTNGMTTKKQSMR